MHIFNSIIIIIMSCRQHGYPSPSLATSPYHSSPLAGLQGYILCPHIFAVCKFELVVLLAYIILIKSVHIYIYIYIYMDLNQFVCVCIYIYIYIYIHTQRKIYLII